MLKNLLKNLTVSKEQKNAAVLEVYSSLRNVREVQAVNLALKAQHLADLVDLVGHVQLSDGSIIVWDETTGQLVTQDQFNRFK